MIDENASPSQNSPPSKTPFQSSTSPSDSKDIFALLVDAVEDYAIFALDPQGVIMTWNAGGRRLKGYLPEEVIGKNFSLFYTDEDLARKHPEHELEIAAEKGKYEEEGWRVKKDGSQFWANIVITALRDPNGQLRGFGKVTRDLTERKKTDSILKESEERFRLLVSNVMEYAIITLDPTGHVTTWNAGAQRIKGYLPLEIIGQHFSKFYPPSEIINGKPDMELRIATDEGRYEDEGWRVRKDGSMFWANVSITALYSETPEGRGPLRGFAKVTRDLTSRRQAEEALRQSQERYRLLIENITDYALILLDAQGRVTSWNAGATKITGYEAKEILGAHFTKFYTEADILAGKHEIELRVATETGRFEEEAIRVRKDGTRYWANVVITVVRDDSGAVRGFSKVTRDVTEQRETEKLLRESEERFRLMVEVVEDYAIFMLDPQGIVTTWNRGAERNKGYEAHEIIGSHFSKFYSLEDVAAGKPDYELKEAVARGRFEDEGWRYRKDGGKFWANIIITPIYGASKELVGFSKVTRNLTERKKAEDTLKASFTELEARVEQRTAELSRAKQRAEKAVAARDQFFSMASHELKTPLSSLKLQAQLRKRSVLKGDLSDFAPENLVQLCEDDDRQINRLTYLVDNMLDISKLTSGALELQTQEVQLQEIFTDLIKSMGPVLKNSGNTLEVDDMHSFKGIWDRHRLDQVFTNLLTNCGKYAPGSLIKISATAQSDSIKITVKDFGPGIPKEKQVRIFDPFERLNTKEASGLGLGLYIIKQIVEAHGGIISIESEIGQGSAFTVCLPLNPNIEGNC